MRLRVLQVIHDYMVMYGVSYISPWRKRLDVMHHDGRIEFTTQGLCHSCYVMLFPPGSVRACEVKAGGGNLVFVVCHLSTVSVEGCTVCVSSSKGLSLSLCSSMLSLRLIRFVVCYGSTIDPLSARAGNSSTTDPHEFPRPIL